MSEASWNTLTAAAPPRPDSEFDAVCADVFTTNSGKKLLALLRKKHFDSPFNQLAPDRALQVRIDNQHFVRDLETARERGLAAAAKQKTT